MIVKPQTSQSFVSSSDRVSGAGSGAQSAGHGGHRLEADHRPGVRPPLTSPGQDL